MAQAAERARALPTLEAVQAERKRRNRQKAHGNLIDFVELTTPGFLAGWVHRLICGRLQQFYADAMAGRGPKLILTMPPRHGKSTIVSQRGPVWAMGRYPGMRFINATYGQDLSDYNSRLAREVARSRGAREVFPHLGLVRDEGGRNDADRVRDWEVGGTVSEAGVESRGQYKATSIGGSAAGRGAHVVNYDDMIKDHKEAASQETRDRAWDWMATVGEARLEPGGGQLLTMTRWHEDDPVGRVKRKLREGEATGWEVLDFEAIAKADGPHRRKGEALHPERWSLDLLLAKKNGNLSPYFWEALYQQDPVGAGGQVVLTEWLEPFRYRLGEEPRVFDRVLLSMDTASSIGKKSARTACLVVGLVGRELYLLDVWRDRVLYPGLRDAAVMMARRWRPTEFVIEDQDAGRQLLQELPTILTDLPMTTFVAARPDTDKWTRMAIETPALRDGRYHVPDSKLGAEHELELTSFGAGGAYKDDGDSLSQLLKHLRENPLGGSVADLMSQW